MFILDCPGEPWRPSYRLMLVQGVYHQCPQLSMCYFAVVGLRNAVRLLGSRGGHSPSYMRWGGNIIKGLIEVSIVRLVPEAKRLDMMGEFFEVLINFFFFFFSTRESFSFLHVVLIPYQGSLALTGLCCGFVNALTKNIKPNMISWIQIAHSAFLFGYTINPRHMLFAESKQLSILHHPVLPHCFWNHGCAPVNCPGQEYLGL